MGAVGFQGTTNYHTIMPKAATPQFLLLEIVVLHHFLELQVPPMRLVFSLLPPFAASRNR